jgi:pilus assembly protein CpaC
VLLLSLTGLCLSAAPYAQPTDTAIEAPAPIVPLAPGQVQTLSVSDVTRVAVGDPAVADVTIVSQSQILLQAKQTGSTNLIIWDTRGQSEFTIEVAPPGAKPSSIAEQVTRLLEQLNLSTVTVNHQADKIFLVGEVATEAQQQQLEQVASMFGGVVFNLTTVRTAEELVAEPAPLIGLSVQVLEMNLSDTEKLGVGWNQSIAFTETQPAASSLSDQLLRIGQSVQRGNLVATLNALVQKNKARVLSEPKLVTASGKEASSFIGVEVPVIMATSFGTATSSVSASIQYRETGVLLKMTPTLHPDGERITIRMTAEVSGVDTSVGLSVPVGSSTILVPGFKSREATTEVTAASGETVVIAGLLEAEDSDSVSQVPALGSIPVFGRLFRSPELKSTQRELVLAITPELIADEAQTADRRLALEQALAVAEVTASVEDPRLRYALNIQDRIAKALRYPQREKELNIDGTVKLKLHLFADGTLGRAMVAESSGIEALDMEALKAAESQAPYPGFPTQMAERELWLEVPVIFRP